MACDCYGCSKSTADDYDDPSVAEQSALNNGFIKTADGTWLCPGHGEERMKAATTNGVILFFVGPPGVGKTTLVRAYMEHLDPGNAKRAYTANPKWTVASGAYVAAGHYKGATFDGADTVGYNQVNTQLKDWYANYTSMPVTIFDGDRFSNRPAWDALALSNVHNAKLRVIHIVAPDSVLKARRAERGSDQNVTWMKGRVTKARNFSLLDPNCIELDGTRATSGLLVELIGRLQWPTGLGTPAP